MIYANLKDLSKDFFFKIEFKSRLPLFNLNVTFDHCPLELSFSFQHPYWTYCIILYHYWSV